MSGLNVVRWDSLRVATRAFLKGSTLAAGMSERAMEEINLIRTGAIRVSGAPRGVSFAGLAPRAETTTVEVETETEETKKCAKCDAMQKASANFCSACGASMKDEDEPDDDDDEEPEARAASLETRSRGRRASADFHTLLGAPVRAPAAARPAPDPLASARAEGTRIANELMGRGPDPMAPIPIAGTRYDPGFEAESTHPVMLDPAVSARENFIKAFNVPPGLAARLDNKTLLSMTGAHVAALKGPRR